MLYFVGKSAGFFEQWVGVIENMAPPRKKFCKRGHPMSGTNVRYYARKNHPNAPMMRVCSACWKFRVRKPVPREVRAEKMRQYRATPVGKANCKRYKEAWLATPEGREKKRASNRRWRGENMDRVRLYVKAYRERWGGLPSGAPSSIVAMAKLLKELRKELFREHKRA